MTIIVNNINKGIKIYAAIEYISIPKDNSYLEFSYWRMGDGNTHIVDEIGTNIKVLDNNTEIINFNIQEVNNA